MFHLLLLFFFFYCISFPPSILSSHLPTVAHPPTAPLLSGCQIKVKIFFRLLGSAFLPSWGYFQFFLFFFFLPQTIEFSFWALVVAFSDWGLEWGWGWRGGGDLFAVCDLCEISKAHYSSLGSAVALWGVAQVWWQLLLGRCWSRGIFSLFLWFFSSLSSSHSSTLSFPSASPSDLLHLFR